VEGNRLETWGGDYPVICLVVEDAENSNIVYSLDGHLYTTSATPIRSFLLFGYLGDATWVWLGTQNDPKQEISDAPQMEHDRLTIATLYDSQPWDVQWLERVYHMQMQPLPENWPMLTDADEQQAILSSLAVDLGGAQP
jgi:hypothetical protein